MADKKSALQRLKDALVYSPASEKLEKEGYEKKGLSHKKKNRKKEDGEKFGLIKGLFKKDSK